MVDKPTAGEVFRYPFLWKRQQEQGKTEGRKLRPVCMGSVWLGVTTCNHPSLDLHLSAISSPIYLTPSPVENRQ